MAKMIPSSENAPDDTVSGWTVPADSHRPQLDRRTVLAGAAWSLPVIAAAIATPLAAASCVPASGTLNWGTQYTRNSAASGQGVAVTTDGRSIPVVVSTQLGTFKTPSATTLVGAPNSLALNNITTAATADLSPNSNYNMNVNFTFAEPVTDLTFTLYAINRNDAFTEYVMVPGGVVIANSAGMTNTGTGWYYAGINPAVGESVTYVVTGPVTTLTIYMSRPTSTTGGDGGVALSNLQFTVPC